MLATTACDIKYSDCSDCQSYISTTKFDITAFYDISGFVIVIK